MSYNSKQIIQNKNHTNLKHAYSTHKIHIPVCVDDIALVSSGGLFKLPHTITNSILKRITLKMKFDFSGYKNIHRFIKL